MRTVAVALLAALVAVSCGGGRDGGEPHATRTLATAPVILESDGKPVLITAEVAETPEQRQRGLMFRESLPEDEGMVFIFFEETSGGFWMEDTLIPLSIAFFDRQGEILEILDMEPCKRDPCQVYDPGVSYWGALEVNQGAFDRWGIRPGDTITISR